MADDYDDNDQEEDVVPRSQIRALEEKAKKAGELEAQLAALQRETAFARALGNTEHPARQYFEKGYDGELDVDAIKTAAQAAGLLAAAQSQQAPPPPDDLGGHARMAANAAGAEGATRIGWQEALAEADRIPSETEREAAILTVVEQYGGVTSRTAQ